MDQTASRSLHENQQETAAYKEILPLIQPQQNDNFTQLISDLQGRWKDQFSITKDEALTIKQLQQAKFEANELKDLISDIVNKAQGYKLHDIDRLSWDFTKCDQFKGSDLKQFASDISEHFKKLHKLSLNLSNCKSLSVDTDGINELLTVLSQNLKYLQQLSLYFNHCGIKDETVSKLGSHISQNLKTLIQLSLDFKDCGTLTDKTAVHLVSEISQSLENLWRLTLDFGNNKLSEGSFEKICMSIAKQLPKLEQVSLGFAGSEWMDDGQFARGMTEIAQNLPNLKEFSLDLFNCPGITEVGIKDLDTVFLEHFDHLEQLNLDFGRNHKITEQAAIQLTFNIVHNLKELKRLGLGFRELLGADSSKKILADIAEYHPNLELLSLDFTQCKINDESLGEITSSLSQNLKGLQRLSLNLGNNDITNDGLAQFASALSQHKKNIQGLDLDLIGCGKITGDSESSTKSTLSFVPNLTIRQV